MDKEFWFQKWSTNEIGFHQSEANALLVAHIQDMGLPKGKRLFLPLCGKTLDIAWLMDQGYQVVGAELCVEAVNALFAELGVEPQVVERGNVLHYSAGGIDIFAGDIFDLTAETLGAVDGIYDRAALVALPSGLREKYSAHLRAITREAPQLLITFEYDQTAVPGPPFSISEDEVNAHYSETYSIACLESCQVPGGLKGICEATETIWLLTGKTDARKG